MRVGLLACMWTCIHNMRQCVCVMWLRRLVSGINCFLFVQEVVDATLLEKVETSIESNKSLQMLDMYIEHSGVEEAVLKGACGNTSLKKLTIRRWSYNKQHLKTAAAELQQVRSELELRLFHF